MGRSNRPSDYWRVVILSNLLSVSCQVQFLLSTSCKNHRLLQLLSWVEVLFSTEQSKWTIQFVKWIIVVHWLAWEDAWSEKDARTVCFVFLTSWLIRTSQDPSQVIVGVVEVNPGLVSSLICGPSRDANPRGYLWCRSRSPPPLSRPPSLSESLKWRTTRVTAKHKCRK
jgi:hypothetical protein